MFVGLTVSAAAAQGQPFWWCSHSAMHFWACMVVVGIHASWVDASMPVIEQWRGFHGTTRIWRTAGDDYPKSVTLRGHLPFHVGTRKHVLHQPPIEQPAGL
ncbi:uncharacterized protein B0I36DRAFT_24271 [Microdochium trichocladiopsis]|uniref:Uncharacterized protein n=1 Tax=Microdochium trichocladiopsis TaxID=1682393 RepID=A0A9P8YH10_9PEZI|nr:uncharacterized protein B0I36DRAFT_24271 [Microdochium trichocladiopsis]KAH7041552.1 hypothetical protein B0I36DRAFT_24271 [Microdochium trichocladiopsis]